jgi:hypothetical protein
MDIDYFKYEEQRENYPKRKVVKGNLKKLLGLLVMEVYGLTLKVLEQKLILLSGQPINTIRKQNLVGD